MPSTKEDYVNEAVDEILFAISEQRSNDRIETIERVINHIYIMGYKTGIYYGKKAASSS